jgi:hypothetical protein
MNTQETLQALQHLKLHGMAKRYQAVLEQPVHQQMLALIRRNFHFSDVECQYISFSRPLKW